MIAAASASFTRNRSNMKLHLQMTIHIALCADMYFYKAHSILHKLSSVIIIHLYTPLEQYFFYLLTVVLRSPIYNYLVRSHHRHLSYQSNIPAQERDPYLQGNFHIQTIWNKPLYLFYHIWNILHLLGMCIWPQFYSTSYTLLFFYRGMRHRVLGLVLTFRLNLLTCSYFDVLANTKYKKSSDFNRVVRAFLNPCIL